MVLKFKGQFNRDIDIKNREVLEEVYAAITYVKSATSISQIQQLKKAAPIQNTLSNKDC